MLDNDDTINDINPFVVRDFSLPGGVRQTTMFVDKALVKEESGFELQEEESPICSIAMTAGDKTIDMCRPGFSKCSDARPLYPMRNIDHGFTRDVRVKPQRMNVRRSRMWIIALILLIAVLLFLIR
jgi:hypothetical protein